VTDSEQAIFLSYASQDAVAAQHICAALRAAGIEVWFDQSELRGGDAWDAAIRKQIKACALFMPIISANSRARAEGYFRLEWKLAVDRSHLMAAEKAFLVPVVIDDTNEESALVPDKFRELQWTRLPAGETSLAFIERILRLLSLQQDTAPAMLKASPARGFAAGSGPARNPASAGPISSWQSRAVLLAAAAVLLLGLSYVVSDRFRQPRREPVVPVISAPAVFTPPAHSLAVLPFVNMSGDPKQDYFSDGLSEELLNSLAGIRDLQVAARTSSFSFKGKDASASDIGRKLNVGAILEGSVRRDGTRVRITAQLINAVTGFHLWSQTYDRDLHNVLALQTDIATAVTTALQATLLADGAASIELGGTQNPQAFDAYLRGQGIEIVSKETSQAKIDAFDEAIRLDPGYAKAYAAKARALGIYGGSYSPAATARQVQQQARDLAQKAVALAPDLAEAHLELATQLDEGLLDFTGGLVEYQRALALAPGDARVLQGSAFFLVRIARTDAALANARRALALDPVNASSYESLAMVLLFAHREREAVAAYTRALSLNPNLQWAQALRGWAHLWLGENDIGRQSCEQDVHASWVAQTCLAIAYDKLRQTSRAQAQVDAMQKSSGEAMAYQYAEIYAQWVQPLKALDWLETAYRLRDPGLAWFKADSFLDPLRAEPRLQELERKLNFPK
jgi:TolB-like protein/lipoprotein NlpI